MDAVFSVNGLANIVLTIIATKVIEKTYPSVRKKILSVRRKSRLNSIKSIRRNTSSNADFLALLSIQTAVVSAFLTVMAITFATFIILPSNPVITIGLAVPLVLLEIAALLKKSQADAAKKRMRKIQNWNKKAQKLKAI